MRKIERDEAIFQMRLKLDHKGNKTAFKEIAQKFNLSSTRVRQIIEGKQNSIALTTLRKNLPENDIRMLDLPARAMNVLTCERIQTIDELMQKSERELMRCPNMGKKSLLHILQALRKICPAFQFRK